MDPSYKDKIFSINVDNIKVNASNSALTRQLPSGKKRKNGGVWPLKLPITFNAVININSQVETLRTAQVNFPQTQVIVTPVTSNSKESTLDMDSHADACVFGANSLVIQDRGFPFNVLSYDPALGDRTYQIVSGVIGYDH